MAVGTLIVALCVFWPRLGTRFYAAPHTPGVAGADAGPLLQIHFPFFQLNEGKQPNGKTDS